MLYLRGSPSIRAELHDVIGHGLLGSAPQEWKSLEYVYLHSGTVGEGVLTVTLGNGEAKKIHGDPSVSDALLDLRRDMYSPEKGIWYTARVTITSGVKMSMDFDYDHEPQWSWKTPPSVYVDDLRMFPREDSAIPDWLRARLAEAGHPLPTGPAGPPVPVSEGAQAAGEEGLLAEHHRRIAEELRHHAPLAWTQMACTYHQAAGTVEALTIATNAAGERQEVHGLMDLYRALYGLRAAMHEAAPDAPLWFTATATLDHDGDLRLEFDADHEPAWDDPVPAATYAEDLARWPRPEHTTRSGCASASPRLKTRRSHASCALPGGAGRDVTASAVGTCARSRCGAESLDPATSRGGTNRDEPGRSGVHRPSVNPGPARAPCAKLRDAGARRALSRRRRAHVPHV